MSEVKRLTITDCSPIKRKDGSFIEGTKQSGRWRLHALLAVDETGLPIQYELKSFQQLPLGAHDIQVEKDSKGDGFILSLPKGSRAPTPPAPAAPSDELRLLADRVTALESAVRGLGGFASTLAQTDAPVAVQAPVAPVASDDDIPF